MPYEQILAEHGDGVAVLTLHRPERMNAWTPVMADELIEAIDAAGEDPEVGAIVVTGAGRGFCAGADVQAVFDAQIQGDRGAGRQASGRDWVEVVRSAKPIVAAVNGPAIGVGLTMILPFDRIVVAADTKLSVRFVQMGLVPELASSTFLPLRCGWGAASDLMLSGRTVLGSEAAALGLADEAVPADEVLDVALRRAGEYARNPGPQLRWIKELLTQNVNATDLKDVQRRELRRLVEAYGTEEHAEAVAAYLEGPTRKG